MVFDTLFSLHERENITYQGQFSEYCSIQVYNVIFTFSSHSLVMTHSPSRCVIVCVCVCVQSAAVDSVLSAFRSICGEDGVSLGEAVREQHGKDESVHRSVSQTHTHNIAW